MTYTIINPNSESPLLVSVEHAGNEWPAGEKANQLKDGWQNKHYAYDLGAKNFALSLADRYRCCVVMGKYSRVLVDLNRVPGDEAIIPRSTIDGKTLNANKNLTDDERDRRLESFYVPYHQAIRACVKGHVKLHLSIHSFEGEDSNNVRLGVLYPVKTKLVQNMLEYFESNKVENIGDNKPYNLRTISPGAISIHSVPFGIEAFGLEFNNRELIDSKRREYWLEHISKWLSANVLGQKQKKFKKSEKDV